MPLSAVRLLVLVTFEVTRVLKLPGRPHILLAKFHTRTVSGSNIADSSGEGPRGALNKLLLDCIDEALIVFSIGICGLKGVHATSHGALEEVPRVSLLETGHAEEILGLLAVSEELDSEGGEQPLRLLVQICRLREANYVMVRLLTVEASIVMITDRDPRDLGYEALLMSRLFTPPLHLVGILAEGAIG